LQAPDYGKVSFAPKPLDSPAERPLDLLSLMPPTARLLMFEMSVLLRFGAVFTLRMSAG
jgi:hypothetical protein